MAEGDFLPPSRRKIPLTKKQLLEMKLRYAEVDERLSRIEMQEKKHRDKNIENPEWV